MIKQTDMSLPWPFHRGACNFMTLAAMVQWETGRELGPDDLMYVAVEALCTPKLKSWAVENDFTVQGVDELLRMLVSRTGQGLEVRIYQIGADGGFWRWVGNKRIDYMALKGKTENGNDHFRLGDRDAKEIYDPNPLAKIVREVSQIYYQVARR